MKSSSLLRRSNAFPAVTILAAAVLTAASLVVMDAQGAGGRQAGPGQGAPGQGGGRGGGRGPGGRGQNAGVAIGTGVISGTVITEGSGSPVRRARVTLTGAELRGGRSVVTDDNGQFTFLSLPAGRFTMTASKSGYVDGTYGAKRAGRPGTPIQLAEGQKLERATISLPRGGVITGIVLDDHGEPSAGTQVRVLRFINRTGEKTLQIASSDSTDDRGVYRIFQLQPGDYIVNAIPRNQNAGDLRQILTSELTTLASRLNETVGVAGFGIEANTVAAVGEARGGEIATRVSELQSQLAQAEQEQPAAYAPVYYPGTTSASAAGTISLGVSEERSGVDFRLQLVPTSRVSGILASSMTGGILPQNTQIALVPADQTGSAAIRGLGVTTTRADATGAFTFSNVTPGTYTIQARSNLRDPAAEAAALAPGQGNLGGGRRGGGPGGPIVQILWASTPVTVAGQDVSGVSLNLQTGMTVSGRLDFRGAAAPPGDLTRTRVSLVPRGSDAFDLGFASSAQADESGRFSISGVPPGTYSISAQLNAPGPNVARGGTRTGGPGIGGQILGAGGRGGPAAGGGQWTLAMAVAGGRDILDFPIEVAPGQDIAGATLTFSDRSQELSGTIQDSSGRPTSDFTIIVYPSDQRYWLPQARRIASSRPDTTGRFSFRTLPPGEYRMTAVTDVEPGEWYDPAFLAQLQQVSIPISLAEGEHKTQDIRLAGGQ